ncbi:MAG: hypothetical protein JXL67_00900 [Calditrichaeota bacterium]|nr:hypothetical protein [Calditrichota bacterium]
MNEKELAKNLIDTLPDDCTLDDIIHALYLRIKIEKSEKEIREGKGIPHEEAKKRLQKLFR